MRIGIDARAATEDLGGRGRVLREVLTALAAGDAGHTFVLFAREPWDGVALDERFSWRLIGAPDPLWHLRTALAANRACDVFLSTNSYLTVWALRIPSVAIVNDLITYVPEFRPQRRARLIELATLPWAVRRATALACISEATARDLVERFPRAAAKTRTFPLAADERFAPDGPPVEPVLRRHDIDGPYVLGVGTLEPRKNLPRLIEAFVGLPDAARAGRTLVLVGARGWETDETITAMQRHAGIVRGLGHVPDADLGALYRGADLFAYPSLYEGFGLPVLEAMRAGTCVLTSSVSSLPEVAGDTAVYVEPRDVASIRAGLERALAAPQLRERLGRAGAERAAAFTWRRSADELVRLLEDAA